MIVSELSDLASRLSLGPIHRFGRLAVVPLIDRTAKPSRMSVSGRTTIIDRTVVVVTTSAALLKEDTR